MAYAASIGDEFTDLMGDVFSVALKVIVFLIIMGLGWIVATWLRRWLARLLQRTGLDRVVARGGLSRVLGSVRASDLTARLVMYAFLIFVLQLAFGVFGPNPVSDLIHAVVAWLPRLFVALAIVVVAAAIGGWVKDIIRGALGGLDYGPAIATAAQVLIVVFGAVAALNQIGVGTTVTMPVLIAALATVGGILVVGVGGGLVRPMQGRWERLLSRAEAESATAADRVRAHRTAAADRDVNEPVGFSQPPYGGRRSDPESVGPATGTEATEELGRPGERG